MILNVNLIQFLDKWNLIYMRFSIQKKYFSHPAHPSINDLSSKFNPKRHIIKLLESYSVIRNELKKLFMNHYKNIPRSNNVKLLIKDIKQKTIYY